jgi:hypothetical protein
MTKDHLEYSDIQVLDWPANSPDINPIENLWGLLKMKLDKVGVSSKQELIERATTIWTTDVDIQMMCGKLIESMPNRLQQVMRSRGGNTNY